MEDFSTYTRNDDIIYSSYAAFLEYAKIPMVIIDEDTTILLCNKAFEKLTGFSGDDVQLKMSWTWFIADAADLDIMKDYHSRRRLDPASVPEEYEFVFKTKSGELKYIALTINMIPGTKRSITFLQDITEKKKSELWYRTVFENTGLPSVIIDSDTRIIMANSQWLNLRGHTYQDIERGMSWTTTVHKDDLDKMVSYHNDRRINNGTAPYKYEFRFVRLNGEVRDAIINVSMIPGSTYSIASIMDITDLRKSETERRELEDQLQQARELESIGQLAGGIAHDFSNMLTGIMGYSELTQIRLKKFPGLFQQVKKKLMESIDEFTRNYFRPDYSSRDIEGGLSEICALITSGMNDFEKALTSLINAGDMIEDVVKASMRAGSLTRQLLAFARRQTLELKPVNLNHLIRESGSILRHTINRNINIEMNLAEDLHPVVADAGQIEQIILNLAMNSQDAMPGGGSFIINTENRILDEVFVMEHPGMVPGEYIMLSIHDSGTGMDREVQEKIF